MPAIELTPAERKSLKADAHALSPVAAIGKAGITPAVLKEIDACLRSHGLIKVRAGSDERDERAAWLLELAGQLDCAPVQSIGRVLVLWRPKPDEPAAAAPGKRARQPAAAGRKRTKRSYQAR
ncbi:MAG: YhbY family RNA-binding protein [Betaproteobacteria bacterium]|jgi:putative YhbY family RNA-binding protein|nr:YhbY family RNA-binding protein [Betaproteobacteria bacterium]